MQHRALRPGLAWRYGLALLLSSGAGCGCARGPAGLLSMNLSAVNASSRAQALAAVRPLLDPGVTASNTNNTAAGSILSTAPDRLTVYLQAIEGLNGHDGTTFWRASDSAGVALDLRSGAVDLSALGLEGLSVPSGHYDGLRVTFARVGRIQGCVKGTFGMTTQSATGVFGMGGHGNNVYTSEAVTEGQTQTFCTRSDKSQLDAEPFSTDLIGHNADYDPAQNGKTTAELVELDLSMGGDGASVAEMRADSVSVESALEFTIAPAPTSGPATTPAPTTTLTLAVDLDRMLRFYANSRPDHNPPNPNMKAGTSYFFTTVFPTSVSAFVGTLGNVAGYQLRATATGASNNWPVDAWMTLFSDSAGALLRGNVMPDDDNTLTIMKGEVSSSSGTLSSGIDLDLAISSSTLRAFRDVTLGQSGQCTLAVGGANQSSAAGQSFDVSYQRLL